MAGEVPKNSVEVEAGREATKDSVGVGDLKQGSPWIEWLKENRLFLLTLIGVGLALIVGGSIRYSSEGPVSNRVGMYVSYVGELFLRILGALILPLIIPNLIVAIGSLDIKSSRKIFRIAVAYYMGTTLAAVAIGTFLVSVIHPGSNVTNINQTTSDSSCMESGYAVFVDTFLDLGRNLFAPNIVQACTHQYRTVRICPTKKTDKYDPENLDSWKISHDYVASTNILGLVTFSIILGITLSLLKKEAKPLMDFFKSLSKATTEITRIIMHASPYAVFFLILGQILEVKDVESVLLPLVYYLLTVVTGLAIHGFLVLPFIYWVCCGKNPRPFVYNMASAMKVAFATASSSAALPSTIKAIQEKNNVDPRISGFVLNVGASLNMDGTALYESVAAIFIAQSQGEELGPARIIMIAITATLASIGAAGIPQAGMMTIVMVLQTVGLPIDDVSRILAVDWLLDRFRTVVNVLGDSIGAGIVHERCKGDLAKADSIISTKAKCDLKGHDGVVNGIVHFNQEGDGPVHVTGSINGLVPGLHGFHVREFREFPIFCETFAGCTSYTPHFNPDGAEHGASTNCKGERHAGDLGNVEAKADGVVALNIEESLFSLSGERSVIGCSMSIHAGVDDLGNGEHDLSKATGNAGECLACGVIRLTE